MRKLLLTIAFLLIASVAFSDTFQVPTSCYPKELQKTFKKHGMKLDLNGNDRTRESWGFIVNKGTTYDLVTYKNLSIDEMKNLQKILEETR